jgi:octaprenyl-diphosphate synthase
LIGRKALSLEEIEDRTKPYVERVNLAISRELALYSGTRFHDPLVYAIEGGKRIRPLILLLSAEALGCTDDSVLDAAVAVELLHTESIIHDDIIDEEATRRDRMTFHVKYGYSASLLTADFVFAMILAIAARYSDRRVAAEISHASLRMAEGEYSELTIDPKLYKLSLDEYIRIVTDKTAELFATSARLGAVIAGGSGKQIDALTRYGRFLGVAYQIRDDLLDWGAKDKITSGLLRGSAESEVKERLTSLSERYVSEAKEQLNELPESRAREFLEQLTDFTIRRKK